MASVPYRQRDDIVSGQIRIARCYSDYVLGVVVAAGDWGCGDAVMRLGVWGLRVFEGVHFFFELLDAQGLGGDETVARIGRRDDMPGQRFGV